MKKDTVINEMNNIVKELDGKELEKIVSLIEALKKNKYHSENYKKSILAGLLSYTDMISVKLDYARLTRKSDPFPEGTIEVLGVCVPPNISYIRDELYFCCDFNQHYDDKDCRKKAKKIIPFMVFDQGENSDLRYGDDIIIADEKFEIRGFHCGLLSRTIGPSRWSDHGRVDYRESNVKLIVDDWFSKLEEKALAAKKN